MLPAEGTPSRTAQQDGSAPKKIKLKLEYNGSKRVAVVYEGYTFARLHERLCEDYKFDVLLEYEDSDGDKVMLNCENDLTELLENEEGTVYVHVAVLQDQEQVPPPPPTPPSLPPPGGPRRPDAAAVDAAAFDAEQQFLNELQLATGKPPPPPPPTTTTMTSSAASYSSSTAAGVSPAPAPPSQDRGWGWRGERRTNVLDKMAMFSPGNFRADGGVGSGSSGSGGGGSFRGLVESGGGGGSPLSFGVPGRPRPTRELGSEGPNPWQLGDEVDPMRWLRGDVIGEGAFGTVHMGLNLDTGELMAVKSISLDKGDMTSKDAKAFINEVAILQDNKHENIVRSYGSSIKGKQIYIFLEFMPGGSVRLLLDRFGVFEEKISLLYAKQVLRGLIFLHANGVAHRDIKCANCLVDHRGSIKLADFGVSKCIRGISGTASGVQSVKGTPFWMAPEVLQVHNLRGGWMKADVWSFGATVLEMCSGSPPWGAIGPLAAMFKISCTRDLPAIPETVSATVQDLMRQCFCRDPSSRPTADELLRHPSIAVAAADRSSHAYGFRPPRVQTTAVPAAAREQGLQHTDVAGEGRSVVARDGGSMSDSDSSTGASSQGYAREAVSSPLDLLTTKPATRIKWGSIGGGDGGGATGNAKPSTVEEGTESQSSSRDSHNRSSNTGKGQNSISDTSLGGDGGNADGAKRAAEAGSSTNDDGALKLSSSPASFCVSLSSDGGGGVGGDGSRSALSAGRLAHRGQESGGSGGYGGSGRSSGSKWSKQAASASVDGSDVASAASAAAAIAGATPQQRKPFGSSRREWGWRDGAPVSGGLLLTPTNSPAREGTPARESSPRGEDGAAVGVPPLGNVSASSSLSLRGSGSWGSTSGGKVGITTRATEWKRRIQERGLESEAERMASATLSAQRSGSLDISDGSAGADAGCRPQQHGDKSSGSTASGEGSSGAQKQSRFEKHGGGHRQAPRRGTNPWPLRGGGGSFAITDVGSGSGSYSSGTNDGAAVDYDGVTVPAMVLESGVAAGGGSGGVHGAGPPTNPQADGSDGGARSSPAPPSARRQGSTSPADESILSSPLPSAGAERFVGGDDEARRSSGDKAREGRAAKEGQRSSSAPEVGRPPRSSPSHAPKA
eukprot:g10504.t1